MARRAALLMLMIVALVAGCTHAEGRIYTSAQWSAASEHLGHLAILPPRCAAGVSENATKRILRATKAAFGAFEGIAIVDPQPLLAELGDIGKAPPISDYDVVVAARKLDIDTVCSLTVDSYSYRFTLGLPLFPPVLVWDSSIHIEYALRLIDVSSGKLLLETSRERAKHGVSSTEWRDDLHTEFEKDLEIVLQTPRAPAAEVAIGWSASSGGEGLVQHVHRE